MSCRRRRSHACFDSRCAIVFPPVTGFFARLCLPRERGAAHCRGTMILASFFLVAATSFGLGRQASLVTWNLLAPTYATQTKFPWASKQALSWSHRRQLIVQQLAAIDADVVCLQEVEVAQWDELYAQLHGLGYDGVLQETRNGHPVACATLFKRDQLVCVRTESRSRAMIAVAEMAPGHASAGDAGDAQRRQLLYVANVHLEAGPQKEQQRLLQLGSLLKRLRMQAEADGAAGASAPSPAAAPPLVIAGDFNCEPHSAAHAMLSARPGDGAPEAASLKGAVAAAAASLLPLHDAYASCPPPWGPALRSTFRNGRVLDYIFTSSAVEVCRAALPLAPLAPLAPPHRRAPHPRRPPPERPTGLRRRCYVRCRSAPSPAPLARTGCPPTRTRQTTCRSGPCCGGRARRSRQQTSGARGSRYLSCRSSGGRMSGGDPPPDQGHEKRTMGQPRTLFAK